jgi:hypothetical protein
VLSAIRAALNALDLDYKIALNVPKTAPIIHIIKILSIANVLQLVIMVNINFKIHINVFTVIKAAKHVKLMQLIVLLAGINLESHIIYMRQIIKINV